MEIHIRRIGQAVVVTVGGDIDGRTAPQARDEVAAQVPPGASILLDMSGVAYMSSAGLRMLLATYRQVKASGGDIVLVGLQEQIAETMSMTGFLPFFTVCETVEEGLASLK